MSTTKQLPENAYRELKPGEVYQPIISPDTHIPEVTPRSIAFGIAMTVLFSAAAAYIALKLGQGIETAIPISILAVGFSAMLKRHSTLLENVNILAIGATSGIIVGGSVFVMPAIFILGLESSSTLATFTQIFLVPFLGAVLGVLFLIPFRRYFVAEMHGKLPFPEATATTEILVSGEQGGKQARVLLYSLGIGIILDYLALGLKAWSDTFTTSLVPALHTVTDKIKFVFALNTSAAILGLGYIIGVRYASIIMGGSFLSYAVLIPLFAHLNPSYAAMDAETIFFDYVRYIGIGGIFAAGFISILKMSPTILQATRQMAGQLSRLRASDKDGETVRTERDIPMSSVLFLGFGVALLTFLYFRFSVLTSMTHATTLALISLGLTIVVSFLFSSVSAWAVAMISITPISGMTLTTLIISAVLLSALGLTGTSGMLGTLLIGGVVCTALSMAGSLVTQFKIGYWLGATPRQIQWSNIAASAISSVTVTAVIILFAKVYGYIPGPEHPAALAAPQANAMAAVIKSVMSEGAPWALYGLGAVIAIIIEMLGISGLAFALGMYLPIELNSPLLLGAIAAWMVQRSTRNEALSKLRNDKGILIASGLIAGGALAGVFDGIVKMAEDRFGFSFPSFSPAAGLANWLGLGVFLLLAVGVIYDCVRVRSED
ncbi:MAG TPA: oligopeptide transporter, OPT family [Thermoanaerobaculia bacterium]|nr:oligopeptide transporter, OPT family [Thermoanaerobaculia bacterium]HXK69132.1 oligopeptide transporter, OPT family [Thermoanaerobaculia bacterium]